MVRCISNLDFSDFNLETFSEGMYRFLMLSMVFFQKVSVPNICTTRFLPIMAWFRVLPFCVISTFFKSVLFDTVSSNSDSFCAAAFSKKKNATKMDDSILFIACMEVCLY